MGDFLKTLFSGFDEDRVRITQGLQDVYESISGYGREWLGSLEEKRQEGLEESKTGQDRFLSDPGATFQSLVRRSASFPLFVYTAKLQLSLLDSHLNPFRSRFERSGLLEGLRCYVEDGEKAMEEARAQREAERKKNLELLKNGEMAALTEGHLNSLLEEKIKNLPIRDLDIHLEPGKVEVRLKTDVKTTILGADVDLKDVEVKIALKIEISDGKVKGRLEKLSADGIPGKVFASFFKETLASRLAPIGIVVSKEMDLNDLSWLQLPQVRDLEIGDGELRLRLKPEES